MCGITGFWHLDPNRAVDPELITCMTATIRHRGPDDEGYLFVQTATGRCEERRGAETRAHQPLDDVHQALTDPYNFAFGFRRLSILDLSPAGHQPMGSADGALWIVFNGEIYNYLELRAELAAKGYTFRSGTDTEVILAAYAEWGAACVERFNGMWSFALWDARQRQLFCARDRFGIKPFYYFWDGQTFAFASELKALLTLPGLPRRSNDALIFDYLTSGLIEHTDETFFAGLTQLPPAHTLTVEAGQITPRRYWDLDPERQIDLPDDAAYAEQFYALFEDAVRLHLRSDVAVGTCLSGGLDSSTIVCVANRLLFSDHVVSPELVGARQKTFSSCFDDRRFDERQYVETVLAVTGAEANYVFPTGSQLLADLQRLVWHQDEPFGSTSIFAQWCVMESVKQRGVKVLLDGQGADELLSGYHGYFHYYWGTLARQGRWPRLWEELNAYHRIFRAPLAGLLMQVTWPYAPNWAIRLGRRVLKRKSAGSSTGINPDFARRFSGRDHRPPQRGPSPYWGYLYDAFTRTSLPGLLRYEDRNSMAHSIEARVPFLDYRLVEYVFALPDDQKIRRALTKYVMRNALQGVLPEPVRTRTDKMGFVTPETVWLNGELRGLINDLIHSQSFQQRGYFDVPAIERALAQNAAGQRDLTFVAWRWVNLELWFRAMIDR